MYFSKDTDSVPTFESPWMHRGWTPAIWKFTAHILLKPGLRMLSITLLACEMNAIVW